MAPHCSPKLALRTRSCSPLLRLAAISLVAAAFWVPAVRALPHPAFPAPLDDVYIYFDFARATAKGCVLCWTPETGYSSGATSPPYALALAAFWLVGLRGPLLGLAAAGIAIASLADLGRSLERLVGGSRPLSVLGLGLVLGVPLLDWTWFSGMEAALFAAIAGRALVATARSATSTPAARPRAQLVAGAWLAALAYARPECVPLSLALGVAVAHGAGALPAVPSLARATAPTVAVVGAGALLNRALTGEAAAAGAVRKLVLSAPYAAPTDVAAVVLKNLVRLLTEGLDLGLGGAWATRTLAALGLAALSHPRTRRLGAALLVGAVAALLLVCLNLTAPFQNLRYLAPTFLLLLVAATLGVRALALRARWAGLLGAAAALAVLASAARGFPRQLDHFRRSAVNIAEQQVEVGLRLRALDPPARRVFVGDAGAIPYVSELRALDGLGLGGDHDLPFARASVHGVPAVVELVERLPERDRPDVLAIYDGWWPELGARFGERLFSVRIEDNVICGDPEKVVYRADWSLLEDREGAARGALDRLDVADLVDEREHAATFTRPKGGWVVSATLEDPLGRPTWDAGRVLAEGQRLELTLRGDFAPGPAILTLRTDAEPGARLELEHRGARHGLVVEDTALARWRAASVPLSLAAPGDRVAIVAGSGGLRVFAVRLAASP